MTSWQAPEVEVVSVRREGPATFVALRLPEGLTLPLAPASLQDGQASILHLDAVVSTDGAVTVFRTEELPDESLDGRTFGLQQWWTPGALAAVLDTSRGWLKERAPSPADHEHCILDWTTIESRSGAAFGWRSGKDWICSACHERYIVEDHLGIRISPKGTKSDAHGEDTPT
jgi:hypothetical protein